MAFSPGQLRRRHAVVFAWIFGVFTVLYCLLTNQLLDDGPGHFAGVVRTTVGSITGPFVGVLARGADNGGLHHSLSMARYVGPFLLLGVLAQFVGSSEGRPVRIARMGLWLSGWLLWFLSGIGSLGWALE